VKVRDRVVLVNNVTALNKLASEIGRDAIKVVTKNKDGMDLYTMRENDNYN
jgi:hypothetical protein